MQQASAAVNSQQAMLRGRTSTETALDFILIFNSKQQACCANGEQEHSQAAADAPGVENVGVNRTEGHDVGGLCGVGDRMPVL